MIRHFFPMLLAGTMLFGPAQALVLAISPLVDQPSLDDPPESKTAPRVQSAPAAEPSGRELPANPLWAIPLKQLSSTRERPIFSPSRRPPSPPVVGPPTVAVRVAPKSAGPQSPEFALIGTVIGEKESIAVFADETTKNAIRLRTGEAHKGWALRSVHAREATLERDGESAILGLLRPGTEQTASIPRPAAERPGTRRR
jgi:hypothetical protein